MDLASWVAPVLADLGDLATSTDTIRARRQARQRARQRARRQARQDAQWARHRRERFQAWEAHQHVPRETHRQEASPGPAHADATSVALFGALMGVEEALAVSRGTVASSRDLVERVLAHMPPAAAPPPPNDTLSASLHVYFGSFGPAAPPPPPPPRGVDRPTFDTWKTTGTGTTTTCAVCLETVDGKDAVKIPTCGHVFDATCLWAWVKDHPTCPTCRAAVR